MTGPSRFSPEKRLLDELFHRAGVSGSKHAPSSRTTERLAPSRVEFATITPPEQRRVELAAATQPDQRRVERAPSRGEEPLEEAQPSASRVFERVEPAVALPSEPQRASADVSLPPMADSDEMLSAEVFGKTAPADLSGRLDQFLAWMVGSTGAYGAFVADAEGLPLVTRNVPETYVAALGPLSRASETIARFMPNPSAGSITVEVDAQHVLEIIWAQAPTGVLGVGLVLAGALDGRTVRRVRRVTELTFQGGGVV